MPITYHYNDVQPPTFRRRKLSNCLIRQIVNKKKKDGNIAIIFNSDEKLLEMNREHLQHDYYTDVITFDYGDENVISGDIYISIDRLKENAKTFGVVLEMEIVRVAGHGVLHLLGYTDGTVADKEKMAEMEEMIIACWKSA